MTSIRCAVLRSLVVVLGVMATVAQAGAETDVRRGLVIPETIRIAPELQQPFARMLEQSPTFRQQIERVAAAPKVIVNARLDPSFRDRPYRARSSMRRYDSGLLVVCMDISADALRPEWIAHEFEHVIEQLEGLHLPSLASARRSGYWFTSGDMVESARAMRAGHTVRDEMRGRGRRSDKFVE